MDKTVDSLEIAFQAFSFNSEDYHASLSNNSFAQANDGLIYVGNLNGVLEFDGSTWRLLKLPSYSLASALFYEKETDRLYTGSTNEFGYFEKDSTGQRQYYSMREFVESDKQLTDIYQIMKIDGCVYFISIETVFKWDGNEMTSLTIRESYFLRLGDEIFVSVLNKGVGIFKNDSVLMVNTELKFELDQVFGEVQLVDNTYLIATYGNGMYTFDSKTYRSEKWDTPSGKHAASKYIADITPWKDSLILIATYEGGLVVSNKEGDVLNILDDKKGLSTNYLGYVHKDRGDNVWIFDYFGIDLLRLQENSTITENDKPVINFISVNDKETPAHLVGTIEPSPADIVFYFYTPNCISEDLEYSVYLEGFDEGWSEWSGEVSRAFMKLEPGEYKFHVKARGDNGVLSQTAVKAISIMVPWHQSIYTYLLVFIFVVTIVFITSRMVTNRLKKDNKQLENLVKERTGELIEKNKDLKLINAELDNFVYRSSHDLVAPLKSLKGLINIAKIDSSQENRSEYLSKMDSRVNKLEEFIKSIMEYSVNSKQKIKKEKVKLDEVITSIRQDLKYYVNASKVELIKNYDLNTTLFTDKKRLEIVLSNLITNSLKYHNYDQPEPTVEVKVESSVGRERIMIIDNGMGIKSEYLEKIFDMFFRASDSSEGSGLGLYIVKDMITKIGGEIKVTSEVGVGTTFIVDLPSR